MSKEDKKSEEFSENQQVNIEDQKAQKNNATTEDSTTTINAGDLKLDINNFKLKNPFKLLKQLYQLKQDNSLSKKEREKKLRNITGDFTAWGDES